MSDVTGMWWIYSVSRTSDKTWARPACSLRMPRLACARGLMSGKGSTRSRKYHASYCKCLSTYIANTKTVSPKHSWVLSVGHESQKIEITPSTVVASLLPQQWWARVFRLRNSWAVRAVFVESSSDPQLGHLSTAVIQHPQSQLPAQLPQTSVIFCFASSNCHVSDQETQFWKKAFLT